jgi:hypothetical protein
VCARALLCARRDAFKVARRVGYAMFGILNGTEVNPDFVQGALQWLACCCERQLPPL